jgi:oxygen-dependent protoporphyrinogen oxidase
MSPRIVIVGAGISGLATAFYLQQERPDAEITVLEISQHVGGLISTVQKKGYLVEQGPSSINSDQKQTLNLCAQLGLLDSLVESKPQESAKVIFQNGKLVLYSTAPKSIHRYLTPASVLRCRLERFLPRKRSQKDESLWQFAHRRFGKTFADFFADAAATEFFAGVSQLLSVRSCFPGLFATERQFGSISRGRRERTELTLGAGEPGLFPSKNTSARTFREGMQFLPGTLAQKLKRPPVLGVGVQRIVSVSEADVSRWMVRSENDQVWAADLVVLTSPAPRLAAMLADLDADLSDALLTIPYAPLIVLNLAYSTKHPRKSIDWSALIMPQRYKRNLLGIECPSLVFPDRAPADHILLRILSGGWQRQEMIHWDEGALLLLLRAELGKLLGIVKPPAFINVVRWPSAVPQMTVGHTERLANISRMDLRHPGLFLGGQSFWGASVNDCLAGAASLAKQVCDFLSRRLS